MTNSWFKQGYEDHKNGFPYRKFSSIASKKAVSEYWTGWKAAEKESV